MRCPIFTYINRFLKKLLPNERAAFVDENKSIVISRDSHSISRDLISTNALKVLSRLNKNGHEAYLVGGSVRDLLLNQIPKDFDIATNGTPEQVKALFRNSRLVGRRFRLIHILFGSEIIEVATFRAGHNKSDSHHKDVAQKAQTGMLLRDNVYGSLEEDAQRRDFTINSLYYCLTDFSVRDYVGGFSDLQNRLVRLIGDPETRYREDPVRLLRAIRFSVKLDMMIEEKTAAPINELAPLLTHVPSARLFDETLKLLHTGFGYLAYLKLREYHLFEPLFPFISQFFTKMHDSHLEQMLSMVLQNTDERYHNKQTLNPAFLFSAMLWYPLVEHTQKILTESGLSYYDSFIVAVNDVIDMQCITLALPKKITSTMRDIWLLQLRLLRHEGKRAYRLITHPKFRAAFDLLEMRAEVEKNELITLSNWWYQFQTADVEQQVQLLSTLQKKTPRKRKNNKPRSPRKAQTSQSQDKKAALKV